MRLEYCGARNRASCKRREALVSWKDGEERIYDRMVAILRSYGWEQVGYAICDCTDDIQMESREEYDSFAEDFREAKRIAIAEMMEEQSYAKK